MFRTIHDWLDRRLRLRPIEEMLLSEPIPGGTSWVYVFGSATLFLFFLQLLTGMFLAIYYAPTPDHAYDSIRFIMTSVSFGPFVRGLHHWGASAMVVAIGLHMLQVYLYGAYKPPREAMWMVGVVLFLLVLAFAFSGYLLPWDQKAYWATQIGINMVGTVPWIGDALVRIVRGGDHLGALTLTRFFALHILFLPLMTLALIALHLFILRRVGPAGLFEEKRAVGKNKSVRTERRRRPASEPFYPRQVFMDAVVMGVVFLIVSAMAIGVSFPLADKANPSDTSFKPIPEWYFLFYYQGLKYVHGPLEPLATWILPGVIYAVLMFLPFLDRNPARNPVRRPTAILIGVLFLAGVFGLMTVSLEEIYAVPTTDPSVTRGRELYAKLPCVGCHRIHGSGGAVGPDLSFEGKARDRDWLVRHFKDPRAVSPGSIMPAFPLTPSELDDLTNYILSLK
ncbi:MAG TPA: cytochrome b N-terminal domain-containing protein [Nitrospiria bacterium]|nr:cytochrome b N-terminal domain-containing protein [Nitrospiria bacterium]